MHIESFLVTDLDLNQVVSRTEEAGLKGKLGNPTLGRIDWSIGHTSYDLTQTSRSTALSTTCSTTATTFMALDQPGRFPSRASAV